MHTQAFALCFRGRLAEAAEVAHNAVEIARLGGQVPAMVVALYEQCQVSTAQGDLRKALQAGEEGLALAQTFPPSVPRALVADALARALVDAGESQRAVPELVAGAGGPEMPFMPTVLKAHSYETLTLAHLALGRVDEADRCAGLAESASGGQDLPLGRAAADRARAAVMLARGDAVKAATLALAAADVAMTAGAIVESGSGRLLAGRALGKANDREGAISVLELALQDFEAAGALGYRDRAVAELRRLGRRRRPASPGDLGPTTYLTAREQEIVDLVAAGKTNREIAGICYLSEKTVESHLSNIFAKLGVSNRKAVVAAAARLVN
jgi:ATP/maltotriose-dependent transcriptional regulator MalT